MPLTIRYRNVSEDSTGTLTVDDQRLDIARATPNLAPFMAVRRSLETALSAQGLTPTPQDGQNALNAIARAYVSQGDSQPLFEVQCTGQVRSRPATPAAEDLLSELQRSRCLWVVYNDPVEVRKDVLQAAGQLANVKRHQWRPTTGWVPPLGAGGTATVDTPDVGLATARAAYGSATIQAPPALLIFEDLFANRPDLDGWFEPDKADLLRDLADVATSRQRELYLIVLSVRDTVPDVWRPYFRVYPHTGGRGGTSLLDRLGTNLTRQASEGRLPELVGREEELDRLVVILNRMAGVPNSPLLVGPPGVGKTALVEGLARLIADRDPRVRTFWERAVIMLNVNDLAAGTSLRGELEENLRQLLREVEANRDNLILFIDEIHQILRLGGEGAPGAQALKQAMSRGYFPVIGATTETELRIIKEDPAFASRFTEIRVRKPTEDEAIRVVSKHRDLLRQTYGLDISGAIVRQAVREAEWYVLDTHLPRSAINLLYDAASEANLEAGRSNLPARGKALEPRHLLRALGNTIGMDLLEATDQLAEQRRRLREHLLRDVQGQDAAVETVAQQVMLRRFTLAMQQTLDPSDLAPIRHRMRRPLSLFFVGPSGVGKTQLARSLHRYLNTAVDSDLTIYDMATYSQEHEAASLIGSPPGYIGSPQGSRLVEDIRGRPRAVVVFDEMEKAHASVLLALLGILDRGEYRDKMGMVGDFRFATLIFTSNLIREDDLLRKKSDEDLRQEIRERLLHRSPALGLVPPEFVSRVGKVVRFFNLREPELVSLLRGYLAPVCNEAQRLGVFLSRAVQVDLPDDRTLTDVANTLLANTNQEGVRLLQNWVDDQRAILFDAIMEQPNRGSATYRLVRQREGGFAFAHQ